MFSFMHSTHSLRRVLAFVALFLSSALLIVGCTPPWQHTNTTTVSLGSKPTSQQLIAAVKKNFTTVNAFHVVMQAENTGTASSSSQIQIRAANGDVIMPDKVKAQATVVLSGQAVTVNLVSIGDTQYITRSHHRAVARRQGLA